MGASSSESVIFFTAIRNCPVSPRMELSFSIIATKLQTSRRDEAKGSDKCNKGEFLRSLQTAICDETGLWVSLTLPLCLLFSHRELKLLSFPTFFEKKKGSLSVPEETTKLISPSRVRPSVAFVRFHRETMKFHQDDKSFANLIIRAIVPSILIGRSGQFEDPSLCLAE